MRALVTGIAGFAGNYLTQLLLAERVEVFGVSLEEEFKPFLDIDRSAVEYHSADLRDPRRISEILIAVRPDLVFHLAARSSPSASLTQPVETFEVNLRGTLSVLEGLRAASIHSRFLFVSSSHVYGEPGADAPLPEEAPLRPASPYAASKAAAEMAVYQYWKAYRVEAVIVRPFNHTGAGQPQGFVVPDLARKVVETQRGLRAPVLEVSDALRAIDFSHVRDIVRGYYSALVNGAPGRTYNLCCGRAVSVQSLAEGLIAESAQAIELRPAGGEAQPLTGAALVGDNSRARRELGWEPVLPLRAALREVLEYSGRSFRDSSSARELGIFQTTSDVGV